MGIPINLYVTTNQNDCVYNLLNEGILHMGNEVIPTAANAMDIGYPYNVERIFHLCSDASTVASLITTLGKQNIPEDVFHKIKALVKGAKSVDDSSIYETMKSIWDINKYVVRKTFKMQNFKYDDSHWL